nr:hypothetical protein [Halovibrio salipaludis]
MGLSQVLFKGALVKEVFPQAEKARVIVVFMNLEHYTAGFRPRVPCQVLEGLPCAFQVRYRFQLHMLDYRFCLHCPLNEL